MDTWHYLRGLTKASSSRNLEFSNKIAISHEIQQFRMIVRTKKCNNNNFRLLGPFRMTVWKFRMIMQNQLWGFPFVCSKNSFWSISHSHARFSHDHTKWKYLIFQLFFVISSIYFFWIHLNHLQINSKSRSKPIALLLSLCIWIFINFIYSLQFDLSFLSPIYQNNTLKWLQNFIKLVSNSCKGNDMLIECFRHNYYLKDVKLIRIII